MKKNITRIYDKKKSNNRRKYMLGIIAILILQIAIYLGAFSRAETVIQVEYVNYYTLETYLSSTDVLSDLNGDYIVLPEVIDNRNVVSYYAEGETNEVKEYKPNDFYYIGDSETLKIQVEYEEQIVTTGETNTVEGEEVTGEETQGSTDEVVDNQEGVNDSTEELVIVDTVYLGNIGQEGEEGTESNPYKSIEKAFEKLQLQKSDGTSVTGNIIIMGTAEISNWASEAASLNKDVIIKGYNSESTIYMNGDWTLQSSVSITDVKVVLQKENLAIYANGYNLVLGAKGDKESLKIGEVNKEYYPDIYGGSSSKVLNTNTNITINAGKYRYIYGGSKGQAITGNTNVTLNYAIIEQTVYGGSNQAAITGSTDINIKEAIVNGSIYGGSKDGNISQDTNLEIAYVEANGSVYGGSENGNISGNTVATIADGKYGIIATANGENEVAITGGSKSGSIGGNVNLTINNATIINGIVAGAGSSTGVTGSINVIIEKIKLGEEGNQTNSIYGYGYTGGANGCKDINITINEITGKPKYIMGYSYTDGGKASGTIQMNLSNINSTGTEIYGGVYTGTQTSSAASVITTNNVKAKLLSAGGTTAGSIKNYNITVNGGSFGNGIYAGISTDAVSNVLNDNNTLSLNNYTGVIHVKNKAATLYLRNSNVTAGSSFPYSNINLTSSELQIDSLASTEKSLGNVSIDANSELSIMNTKKIVMFGNLSGNGKLKLADATTVLFENHGIEGAIELNIIEDEDDTSSYLNVISAKAQTQDELYLNPELTGYTTEFAESISYWKFYKGDNAIQSAADCVYLHSTYGDDTNSGELKAPVKTIEQASNIIKNNSAKKKVVILSNLNVNDETAKTFDTSNIYTIITSTDGIMDYGKNISLSGADGVNNIYQNLELEEIEINAGSGTQKLFLNGNSIKINSTVTTVGKIEIYGGSDATELQEINNSIEIRGGTWQKIYGGSNAGSITGTTNVNIYGGYITEVYGGSSTGEITGTTNVNTYENATVGTIYGGSNSGNITGTTNINVSAGDITTIYGGNYQGTITGDTNVNVTGGKITKSLYGGNNQGSLIGNTNVEITGGTITGEIYGGNNAGQINGTANTNITGGTVNSNVYGGSNSGSIVADTETLKATNLVINNITIGRYQIYGGSNSGNINGNVNIIFTDNSFGATTVYRGSNSGTINGEITSTFNNVAFTSLNGQLYGGSNSGAIVGNLKFSLGTGAFKNNTCYASVCGGSNSGTISGNLDVDMSNIKIWSDVYGGSKTGIIDGNTTYVASGNTFNSTVYLIGKLGLSSSNTQANSNSAEIKDSTVKEDIYAVTSTGNNILAEPSITIDNVTFRKLYAFNTFTSMDTKLNINLLNSNGNDAEIPIEVVASNQSIDLKNVLVLNLQNNEDMVMFYKDMKLNNLKIDNSNVISELVLDTENLTLINNGALTLRKNSNVTNTFTGATDENYGKIEVYDGLNIGGATGKTTLAIGKITETKASTEENSATESFINIVENQNIVEVKDEVVDTNKVRTWNIGNINGLDIVYVDGTNGKDTNSGENYNNALASLKLAFYYCRTGGTIVICGPTEITEWPDNSSKAVTITSKYDGVDYRNTQSAILKMQVSEAAINLTTDLVIENIDICVTKTQNIYASGNNLTLGESINVVDANGNATNAYLNIYGGGATTAVQSSNIIIKSGSYNIVDGAGVGNNGDTNITIDGGDIKTVRTKGSSRYSSNKLNLIVANATIQNIYYEPDKNTEITLNSEAKVTNINSETYSQNVSTDCNINVNTKHPVNIDGRNKGNTKVNIGAVTIEDYTGSIKNVTELNIANSNINFANTISGIAKANIQSSTVNVSGTTFSISNLAVNTASELVIEATTVNLGEISFDSTSTIKILSALETLKITGEFYGGGKLYLNDGVTVEISGRVFGSTTVYCNEPEYFAEGVIIRAKISAETLENAFVMPETNEIWKYKDNEGQRIWKPEEFEINNIIYVNSASGTSSGLGTVDTPVNTIEGAYNIANKRYSENNEQTQYYIVFQEDLELTTATANTKLNENVEVIITNKVEGEKIEYNSALKINTSKFNFVGKTTIENITIDTTAYADVVELYANGNEVTFGNGIIINSQARKYPIIYGGSENVDITKDEIKLTVLSGKYNMIFGGGKNGNVNSNINLIIGTQGADGIDLTGYAADDDNYTGLFGAGQYGSVTGNINLDINKGTFYRIYGAGLEGTLTGDVTINFVGGQTNRVYGGGQNGEIEGNAVINIGNAQETATVYGFLRGSGQYSGITGGTEVNIYSGAVLLEGTQVAAGGYQGHVSTSKLNIYGGEIKCDVYGGGWGNIGDSTKGIAKDTEVHVYQNAVIEGDVYGGGYAGPATNTNVLIEGATINNVYGGGNEAEINENTNVKIKNAIINESAYAGGKGTTATVKGNSTIIVEGTTSIQDSVFGGGNASMTGLIDNNSITNVYIVGGTINGDVYGGANTSVVYGNTNVKIGRNAVNIEEIDAQPIDIKGTVFGGGKSNTAGSEDYDFTFESVTEDVNIEINGAEHEINIGTSIFASGNAAKISGDGYITISNYGTYEEPKKLVSIQRATDVTLDNTALWIFGTTDRTNEMSSIKYTINRVKALALKNNSTLYLESGVNLVENLKSLDKDGNLEYINIDEESGIIEQNVDNKIYLLHGKNMILLTEAGGNGSVYGMMFLGKFDSNQANSIIEKGIYSSEYTQGDIVDEEDKTKLVKNSYLQAQHYTSHDTTKDGFYTNNVTEDSTINIQYITPTPEEGTFYQWLIGEKSETIYYDEIELIASRYSSTGQVTVDLVGLNAEDMILEVESIDTSLLNNDVILNEESQIANIAESEAIANSVFGLTMESGHQGWKTGGTTNYLYKYNEEDAEANKYGIVQGTTSYYADKSNTTPSLTFNFAHSKNVSSNIDLGKVYINLKATYLEEEILVTRDVVIELLLRVSNATSGVDYYEGAITPGLKYSAFPTSATNITSKSAISAYYSIYLSNYDTNKFNAEYEGYYHAINSSFVLPAGAKIIIVDKSHNIDNYYYYIVTADDEQNGKTLYKFTEFTLMGTLDEKYNADSSYYNQKQNHVMEEFIVQLDLENTDIKQDYIGASLKIQLMNELDDTVVLTVNDEIYPMIYNIYRNQEPEKVLTIDKEYIHMYEPEDLQFTINLKHAYKTVNSNIVYDTTNFDNAEGLRVTFYLDEKQLTKEELGEISVTCEGTSHFVHEDGSIRFKIADAVCNLEKSIKVNLTPKQDWKGTYIMIVEAIASTDGTNATNIITSDDVTLKFSSNEYGLDVKLDENSQIIEKENGNTLNGNNILEFNVEYEEGIANPNIRVALYRRNYDEVYAAQYEEVDLKEFVKDELITSSKEKEYIVTDNPQATQTFTLNLKDDNTLKTGTYKVKFLIYDGDVYIGEVYKMLIIKW